jgi:hypothetical protein
MRLDRPAVPPRDMLIARVNLKTWNAHSVVPGIRVLELMADREAIALPEILETIGLPPHLHLLGDLDLDPGLGSVGIHRYALPALTLLVYH